jgi:uncharacterized protein YprB with RNaseH-like and TPR domain
VPPEDDLQTGERDTPHGPLWVAHAAYGDLYRHGRIHLATARAWDGEGLARLSREPRAASLPLERWAFVDVETTGLGALAGTYAFLVGIGWMDAAGFHVEQLLMRDPGDEPALLDATAERLAAFEGLVTFNGKAFDVPLLTTRFAMARRPVLHAGLAHCDVLHASRRVWSQPGASCGLSALEARVLGLHRDADVQGRLIPSLYHDYLRRRDAARLDPVLAHNRQDLVSLLLLAAEAGRFLAKTWIGDHGLRPADPARIAEDRLRAARVHWHAGDIERAVDLLLRCLPEGATSSTRMAARSLLAYIRKRQGDLDSACRLWEDMFGEDPTLFGPVEELAKACEHQRRDPSAALAWVDRLCGSGLDPISARALDHRRSRLTRKIGGQAAAPAGAELFPRPPCEDGHGP